MIRILHMVSKMDRAGQETFIMNVYRLIDRKKMQFNFLCTRSEKGDYDDEIYSLGGNIYYLETSEEKGKLNKYLQKINFLTIWLKEHKECYDIVHLHTYHALDAIVHLEACRRAHADNVFIHSHNSNGPHIVVHKFCRAVFGIYKFERLACSELAAKWMYGGNGLINKKVTIIYNGIDTSKFKYDKAKAKEIKYRLGIEDKIVIGHIGRFSQQKNHKFLIRIFAEYLRINPNSVLVLMGRGELEKEVRRFAEELSISEKIIFLGVCANVNEILNAFDIFVFPSLYEGLGLALWEAQCNGLPVLVSDTISDESVISDAVHLLPIDDARHWAKEIDRYKGIRTTSINFRDIDSKETSKRLIEKYKETVQRNR